MIKFRCPRCQRKIGMPEDAVGRVVRCPACANGAVVPGSDTPTEELPELTEADLIDRPDGGHAPGVKREWDDDSRLTINDIEHDVEQDIEQDE